MGRAKTRKPTAERKKEIADAVTYSFGHWIRVDALAILAEGKISVGEVAEIIGIDVKLLSGHINGLYDCGCIEDAGIAKVRNTNEHFYRAVTLPFINDEEYRAMSPQDRRDVIGLIIQAIIAETLASLRAGKLENDDDVRMIWDCLNLDTRGHQEVADCLAEAYDGVLDIKAQNVNRLAESGESGTTMIVSLSGFERSRSGRPDTGYGSPRNLTSRKTRT